MWAKYFRAGQTRDYEEYRDSRKITKQDVKKANKETGDKCGYPVKERLTSNRKLFCIADTAETQEKFSMLNIKDMGYRRVSHHV